MSALLKHRFSYARVDRRIDGLQSVTQYCDGRQPCCEGSPVGSDVNSVSEAAYNQQLRKMLRQSGNDLMAQPAAVFSGMPCAYHAEYHRRVKVSVTPEIKSHGRIFALSEPRRVIVVKVKVYPDIVPGDKFCFPFGGGEILMTGNSGGKPLAYSRDPGQAAERFPEDGFHVPGV